MTEKSFDEKISEALKKGSDQSEELHQENFQAIVSKIDEIEKKNSEAPKRKSSIGRIVSLGTAAAVLLICMGVTQPGQAALEKIRQFFAAEKQVETHVEGDKELLDSRLQYSDMGYVIYYDNERYKLEEGEDSDRIVMKETYEGIPEVYMEISQDKVNSPEELAAKLGAELNADFSKVSPAEKVTEPLEAIYIHAIDGGSEWDDEVVNYYLVDNGKGGSFIIKQKYFLEAAEGHGARFYSMLKEFVIVEEEPAE